MMDRGVVELKGKGPLRTWFLLGRTIDDGTMAPPG
jgi:hypothetical protein